MEVVVAFLRLVRRVVARLVGRGNAVSAGYKLHPPNSDLLKGWTTPAVAERQHQAYEGLIRNARSGNPRLDFRVAAELIAATEETNPMVLEIGCGSGYYSEILPLIMGRSIRYVGLDYSHAMTKLARSLYGQTDFITGDALALPIATEYCDICLSGTSLMHIPDFRTAVREMARASRRWCVFHTVPVMEQRATTVLSKLAYGEPVPEIIFNRAHLEQLFADNGLKIRLVKESFPYDVSSVVGEKTVTLSYLCERIS